MVWSSGYYLKDPKVSQYPTYVTRYDCLQKLKRIPDQKVKRAEGKAQGSEHKTQDDHGACAQKGLCTKGPSAAGE